MSAAMRLIADLHARLGAGRRGDVVVVHRQIHQRGFDVVAAGGEFLGARRLELERTFGRIGGDRHRRVGQRRFQLRIGEVGDALEDVEVGHRREREARQHDRLAADPVGQRAEHDEARRADQERDGDHDLRGDTRHFQGLGQEEQRVELAAIPHHRFAGGGAEQSQDRDLEVFPLAERFRQRPLGLLAFLDHALEQRRFIELEPDPDRDREQDGREQERNAPAPIAERLLAHRGADAEDQQQRHEQAERRGGLNP